MIDAKELIITELSKVKRNGIQSLIKNLESSTFFTDPASSKYHLSIEGGLAIHSWNVFKCLSDLCTKYKELKISADSVRISAILHDLCKVGCYEKASYSSISEKQKNLLNDLLDKYSASKNYRDSVFKLSKSGIEKFIGAVIKDKQLPSLVEYLKEPGGYVYKKYDSSLGLPPSLPHGYESARRANKFIELRPEEYLAIVYHMSTYDDVNKSAIIEFNNARNFSPLVGLLQIADQLASTLEGFKIKI